MKPMRWLRDWQWDWKKKTAYNVFKNMDSSNSLKYTEKVLKSQVGNWKSLVPGYSTGKISSMYRK